MSKRPAVFAAVAAAVMIIIAIPFFSMRLGSADAGTDPSSTTTRKAYDLLAKGFGPGLQRAARSSWRRSTRAPRLADFKKIEQAVASTPGVVGCDRRRGSSSAATAARRWRSPTSTRRARPQDASTTDLLTRARPRRPGGEPRYRV